MTSGIIGPLAVVEKHGFDVPAALDAIQNQLDMWVYFRIELDLPAPFAPRRTAGFALSYAYRLVAEARALYSVDQQGGEHWGDSLDGKSAKDNPNRIQQVRNAHVAQIL